MKYKCLVLDHDDTVVDSTASIHYPSLVEFCKIYRPDYHVTLEEYMVLNFEPGIYEYLKDILQLSDEEFDLENEFWNDYVIKHIPHAFKGIKEILEEFKARGGYICVSSHSYKENILRDYKANDLPIPDLIYGWELPQEKRKPATYTLEAIMKELNLKPDELVMVDDLKPGKVMADNAGVDFIGAGWAYDVKAITDYMSKECRLYCKTVEEFKKLILD